MKLIKKIQQVYGSLMIYFHFEILVLALHCYFGDEKWNMDFFQITCFKESENMVVVVPITYTLEKTLFAVATFVGLQVAATFQNE